MDYNAIKAVVLNLLLTSELCRDDESRLIVSVWANHLGDDKVNEMSAIELLNMISENKLPNPKTICDISQKYQELNIKLRGKKYKDSGFTPKKFYGAGYDESIDKERLEKQASAIYNLMQDGVWRTLSEIEEKFGYPQASISACLRLYRRKENGSHTVNKQRRGDKTKGLFEYQLILNT